MSDYRRVASIVLLQLALFAGSSASARSGDVLAQTVNPVGSVESVGTDQARAAQPDRWIPEVGASWWWQIENTAELDVTLDVDVFDIDLFEGAESGIIAELRGRGQRVVCYFSAGTYEPFRPDQGAFSADALISGSELPQFDNEVWLNIGNATALETVIKPIMAARLDLAREQGCDGVEPDNVDGYENEETAGQITPADQLAYNRWLARAAHDRGMSVGLKNSVGQLAALVSDFDFAVNEQCFAFGNECVAYESTFLAAGKAVFNQEYGRSGDGGQVSQAQYESRACTYFRSQNIASLWKNTLSLDGRNVVRCVLDDPSGFCSAGTAVNNWRTSE